MVSQFKRFLALFLTPLMMLSYVQLAAAQSEDPDEPEQEPTAQEYFQYALQSRFPEMADKKCECKVLKTYTSCVKNFANSTNKKYKESGLFFGVSKAAFQSTLKDLVSELISICDEELNPSDEG